MPTQLLIYETAVPLSFARHADCFVDFGGNYAFSGKVNSVPLMAVEFPQAAAEYPFVFSQSPDGERLLLCIDEAFSGFNREGRGQRLFAEDGKPTPYVDNILKFLQEYQTQF